MKTILRRRGPLAVLVGAIALSVAACTADFAPSAPRSPELEVPAEPSNLLGLLGADGLLAGLLSNLSLHDCDSPDFASVSKSIGPAGGVIRIGPHSLTVPAGALSERVLITATARAGKHVKVDLEPHGLRFKSHATLRLGYGHCDNRPLNPKVVYVDDAGDALTILELVPAVKESSSDRVTAWLSHFSGYAIAD